MATTDVIFRIGTLGITKTQAELGIAAAAIIRIGSALKGAYEEADRFDKIFSSLTAQQKKNVMAMDTATKGYISTIDTMTAVSKLNFAGVKTSSEGMAAMAKLAAVRSKDLGETSEQAGERLERMTDAIVRGTDRALKQYNVELTSTGTLTEKQAELFQKIVERAKELEIELAGLDEKWAAMNNTIDTSKGLVFSYAGSIPLLGGAVDGINDIFSNFNEILITTNGSYLDMMFDIEMSSLGWNSLVNDLGEATASLLGLDNAAALFAARGLDLKGKETSRAKEIQKKADEKAAAKAALGSGERKKKPPFGGGKKKEPISDMVFTEEEVGIAYDYAVIAGEQNVKVTEDNIRVTDLYAASMMNLNLVIQTRLDYLREMYVLQGLNTTETEEWYELEMEFADGQYEQERRRLDMQHEQLWLMEQQMTMSDALKDAVRASSVHMSASTAMVKSGWDMSTGALKAGVRAAIQGRKDFAKAIREMVVDVLTSLAEMAAVQALVEFAQAIAAAASFNYVAAAEHAAAGALWIAAAVAAGAAAAGIGRAGGGSKANKSAAPATGGGSGKTPGAYDSGGYGGGEATVIKIYVEGTMATLFNQLRVESERQRMTGAYDGAI